ncbi:recombinase [Enterococcus faecium]|nr:recombinase [Enterococcus faecium]
MHRTFGSRGCPTLHLADRYAERKTPTLCFAFSARMRQAGIPLEDIKDFLGHKDVSTTQVYAHISPEVKKRSMNWNGNSFFDKFYKVQNFFPYAIPIVLDNEPPRM